MKTKVKDVGTRERGELYQQQRAPILPERAYPRGLEGPHSVIFFLSEIDTRVRVVFPGVCSRKVAAQ